MMRVIGCSTILFHAKPASEALSLIADAGFGTIDLGAVPSFCPHVDLDDPDVSATARLVSSHGFVVASVNSVPWVGIDPADSDAVFKRNLVALAAAQALETKVMTVDAGKRLEGESRPDAVARWARHTNRVLDAAEGSGVEVQIEAPHTGTLAGNVDETTELLDALDRPVRITYDTSHIIAGGDTTERSLQILGPLIGHVHLRDARGADIHFTAGDGEYDFAALLKYLDGRDGQVALVLEPEYGAAQMSDEELTSEALRGRDYVAAL